MTTLIVDIRVKPEAVERWMDATFENVEASREEPGILAFDLYRDRDDPARFLLIEEYLTEAAMAAHKETPHYNRWREIAEPLQAEPRVRSFWNKVDVPTGL